MYFEKKQLSEHVIEPKLVSEMGDYVFCFSNSYSRQNTIVAFEYDLSLELDPNHDGQVKQRVDKEKKNFLIKAVNDLKKINDKTGEGKKTSYEQKQHQLWDMLKNNLKNIHQDEALVNKQDETIKVRK